MRRLTTLLLLAATVLVAGCGGDGATGAAELSDRANTICRKYAMRAGSLGQPDPANTTEYFSAALDLARRQQDELEAIDPEDEVAADYERLLDANRRSVELLADLAEVAQDDDADRYAELVGELEPLRRQANGAAVAVGAQDCGG